MRQVPMIDTNGRKKSHRKIVIEHLKKYGSITQIEAVKSYNMTRLAPRVHEINKVKDKTGIEIVTIMKQGNSAGVIGNYAEYYLVQK